MSLVAVFALLFTSCSKDEAGVENTNTESATLSFGAIVNDLVTNRAASKQAIGDLPDCNDAATADYVHIYLVRVNDDGSTTPAVGTAATPYRVNLVSGQVYTQEDAALELVPGNYRLEHFAVYDEVSGDDDLIWLAPRAGSALGEFVDNALPLNIDLRAGVKKYVDVSVLCFDNRNVNQYGYLFFEIDTNVALTYCFFANVCDDDGMHYTARYSVSIWSGTNANGVPLYTNVVNNTDRYNNGDFYATPLCFALPDNDDMNEEYLYYEVTLLDWEGNYGDVAQVTESGTITKAEILANFGDDAEDNVEYNHIRFGCD